MRSLPLLLGDTFPDFSAETSQGRMDTFHSWMGGAWAILFSHPADFTPVCTTELARAAQLHSEFSRRNVQMAALSCNPVDSHVRWIEDILAIQEMCPAEWERGGGQIEVTQRVAKRELSAEAAKEDSAGQDSFPFPIIADEKRELATMLGMLDPMNKDSTGAPMTVRAVFVVDPQKRLRLSMLYPASTGRNFCEILRVIDSLQLTDNCMVATPEGWTHKMENMNERAITGARGVMTREEKKQERREEASAHKIGIPGSSCVLEPRVSDLQAVQMFGTNAVHTVGLPSGKPYLRVLAQPTATADSGGNIRLANEAGDGIGD